MKVNLKIFLTLIEDGFNCIHSYFYIEYVKGPYILDIGLENGQFSHCDFFWKSLNTFWKNPNLRKYFWKKWMWQRKYIYHHTLSNHHLPLPSPCSPQSIAVATMTELTELSPVFPVQMENPYSDLTEHNLDILADVSPNIFDKESNGNF